MWMIGFLMVLWYVSGILSFIYWWTADHDFVVGDLVASFVIGFMGPIAFLIGWSVHGQHRPPTVLIPRRKSKL